jgi:hypothetical protein
LANVDSQPTPAATPEVAPDRELSAKRGSASDDRTADPTVFPELLDELASGVAHVMPCVPLDNVGSRLDAFSLSVSCFCPRQRGFIAGARLLHGAVVHMRQAGSSSKRETRIFQQDLMDLPETRTKEHR